MSDDSKTGVGTYGAHEGLLGVGWPAILIFFAAYIVGASLSTIAFKTLVLAAIVGGEATAISRAVLEPVFLVILVMASARPRGARQLAWFGMLTLLVSLFAYVAGWFAGLAQIHAGPGRLYFVSNSMLLLLFAPAYAAVMFAMKGLAMLPDRGGKPGLPHWVGIAIPGFLAAALILDLLDAGGLMVAADDLEGAGARLLAPALIGTLITVQGAEPRLAGHWILLGSVVGAVAVGGVTVFTLVQWYLADDGGLFSFEAPYISAIMLQFAMVYIVQKATHPTGPWPEIMK